VVLLPILHDLLHLGDILRMFGFLLDLSLLLPVSRSRSRPLLVLVALDLVVDLVVLVDGGVDLLFSLFARHQI